MSSVPTPRRTSPCFNSRTPPGRSPANLDTTSTIAAGDEVTGVGDAGGTSALTAAAGTVTRVDQTITASSEDTSDAETLTGLIQVDADIQSGDSGGPLYDADGEVIGIDTAASSGTAAISGFTITIAASPSSPTSTPASRPAP